ncbi:MAG: NUDIX hydrolase [Thermoanaerobaculia bacterium]
MPEEMIDLLRPDGTPLGQAKPKSLVHRDGDLHRTAHLWIVTPDRRVLLQLRASTKVNHPSLWDVSVAGHVDAGESPEAAAIREAREELGIEIAADDLQHLATMREQWTIAEKDYFDNEVQEVYVVTRAVELSSLVLQPGEVDDVALVTLDELRTRVERRDTTMVGHWDEIERVVRHLSVAPSA